MMLLTSEPHVQSLTTDGKERKGEKRTISFMVGVRKGAEGGMQAPLEIKGH